MPQLHGDDERLLQRLFRQVEVAEEADERGQRAATLVAVDPLELGHSAPLPAPRYSPGPGVGMIGRTSMVPTRALGMRAARSMASSRSFASTR